MIEYPEIEQGTDEWSTLRRGRATASNFDKIVTPGGKPSASAKDYACQLIADSYMIGPESWTKPSYQSDAMDWGLRVEAEARNWFELESGLAVRQVGFCTTDDGRYGCSPDGLVDPDSGLELKCPALHTHIRYLVDGVLPTKYKPQVHGSMIATGRDSWHFMSYHQGVPPLLLQVERDDYTDLLAKALEEFWTLFQELSLKVRPTVTPLADANFTATGVEVSAGAVSPF